MNLLADLHLGRPVQRGALTLFPVWTEEPFRPSGVSLANGRNLTVAEREGRPQVSELVVTSTGSRPVLLPDGTLLEGGWQHRVAARSLLVPVGGSLVAEVSCVERGRWSGASGHDRVGRSAPQRVRAAQHVGEDPQAAVWARVSQYSEVYGQSPTDSLAEMADRARQRAGHLVAGVRPLPGQRGVVVGLAGKPVGLELFASPGLLARRWPALLDSYAMEALTLPDLPTPGYSARLLAELLASLEVQPAGGAGAADALAGEDGPVVVRGLTWRGRRLHATALDRSHPIAA